tara:strand:- start:5674 stop:5880 length:207 start_codon:yes stop_codon:yes gene_type:complete
MPTVAGDGDIYNELARLLKKYDKVKDKSPGSKEYKDFLAISYRLGEINVNGRGLAESWLARKLLKRNS